MCVWLRVKWRKTYTSTGQHLFRGVDIASAPRATLAGRGLGDWARFQARAIGLSVHFVPAYRVLSETYRHTTKSQQRCDHRRKVKSRKAPTSPDAFYNIGHTDRWRSTWWQRRTSAVMGEGKGSRPPAPLRPCYTTTNIDIEGAFLIPSHVPTRIRAETEALAVC